MLKVYAYKNCSTCRKALQFLESRKIPHTVVPIRETPPTVAELKMALKSAGEIRRLFNTSGQDYRSLDLKNKLPSMNEEQALALFSKNGNLVKRPFAIGNNRVLVGFKEEEWEKLS